MSKQIELSKLIKNTGDGFNFRFTADIEILTETEAETIGNDLETIVVCTGFKAGGKTYDFPDGYDYPILYQLCFNRDVANVKGKFSEAKFDKLVDRQYNQIKKWIVGREGLARKREIILEIAAIWGKMEGHNA